MHSFRRFALFLALGLPAMPVAIAQSSSSSSSNPTETQSPDQISQNQGSQSGQAGQTTGETQGQISVQAAHPHAPRQRRATAIHDAYDHKWESFVDLGYQRFQPGPSLQRTTFFGWETGLTEFNSERLGYTLDGRGYDGTAYTGVTGLTQGSFHPAQNQRVRRYVRPHLSLLPATQVLHRGPRHGRLGVRQLLRRHQWRGHPSVNPDSGSALHCFIPPAAPSPSAPASWPNTICHRMSASGWPPNTLPRTSARPYRTPAGSRPEWSTASANSMKQGPREQEDPGNKGPE